MSAGLEFAPSRIVLDLLKCVYSFVFIFRIILTPRKVLIAHTPVFGL
jgi:hypothetical protein